MSTILYLLRKPAHKQPLQAVEQLNVSVQHGILGNVKTPPLRQVLLLEKRTLQEFHLQPGDLRENIIVQDMDLYALPSGTVLQAGDVRIGLTFHCEPCKIIADKVNLKDIRSQRGYLGRFLTDGSLHVGDSVRVTNERVEAVPDVPVERIKWYVRQIEQPVTASELMWRVGLASSYCRALPAMLKKHPEIDADKIIFQRQLL